MPTTKMNKNKTKRNFDSSVEQKHYVRIPRIIWAKSRSAHDLTFYGVVRDIAGEDGECWLGTDALAKLCMMSHGQVCDCRDFWLSTGYITGVLVPYKDHTVWHLRITNVWRENTTWAEQNTTIASRVEHKNIQKKGLGQGYRPKERACKRCGKSYTATGKRSMRCGSCAREMQQEQIIISKMIRMPQKNFIMKDAICYACEGMEYLELHLVDPATGQLRIMCQSCHDHFHGQIHQVNS